MWQGSVHDSQSPGALWKLADPPLTKLNSEAEKKKVNTRALSIAVLLVAVSYNLVAMSFVGELTLPDYRVPTANAQETMYGVVQRLNQASDIHITGQIAVSEHEYEIRFIVTSIEGPGGRPNVEVHLIFLVSDAGISTAGSFIIAFGFHNSEVEQLFRDTIQEIVLVALGINS